MRFRLSPKMKCFLATALIVLVAVFCISHVDGSRASEVKSIEKHQVPLLPRNPEEPCNSSTELNRRIDALGCRNQQLLNVFAGCGRSDLALREEQKCGRNEAGRFCYDLSSNTTVTQLARSVVSNCSSFSSCGFSCNNSLQLLRNSTGCCANYLQPNLNLWSLCGLRPPNNCSSTLGFAQRPNEMVCSPDEERYRLNRLLCSPDYMTSYINILRDCSREEVAQGTIDWCSVNKYGRFCFEVRPNASRLVDEVGNECFPSSSLSAETCPLNCTVALHRIRTDADCCLNNLYNKTLLDPSISRITNRTLWSMCGVSSPGFCQNSPPAHSVMLQFSVAVTGLSTIFAMLV